MAIILRREGHAHSAPIPGAVPLRARLEGTERAGCKRLGYGPIFESLLDWFARWVIWPGGPLEVALFIGESVFCVRVESGTELGSQAVLIQVCTPSRGNTQT